MSSLYTDIIQDAYRYPAHRGELPEHTHAYEDENPLCGDMVRVEIRVEEGRIAEARFGGRGCAISQASAELMCDLIEGRPVEDVGTLDRTVVLEELGLPTITPARLKCALLPVEVMKRAVGSAPSPPAPLPPGERGA